MPEKTIDEKIRNGELSFTTENFIASRIELISIYQQLLSEMDRFSSSVSGKEKPKEKHLRIIERSIVCTKINSLSTDILLARSGMVYTLFDFFSEGYEVSQR